MDQTLQLVVGLGNPGDQYASTRHNAGQWWVDAICQAWQGQWQLQKKLQALLATIEIDGQRYFLMKPATYMNLSGQAVHLVKQYYQIPTKQILIAHDEIDLPVGTIKLKWGGGHGGHNGLRHIIQVAKSPDFYRLRIGVDHPGHKHLVESYVLSKPSGAQQQQLQHALNDTLALIPALLAGQKSKIMKELHTTGDNK